MLSRLSLLLLLLVLVGCGQRGPLYLPDAASETETPIQADADRDQRKD